MKDDRELTARCGKRDSFKIPEGYFEQLHEQLMQNLPDTQPAPAPAAKVTLMARIKPWLYMAATFVGIIFMVQSLMYVQESRFPTDGMAATEDIYTDEIDRFMSSSLYNEYVLYSYLTMADYE